MNRDEIMEMKLGPELNQLVAEKVMGWKYSTPEEYMWFNPTHYIEAAWKVVERMRVNHIYNIADFGRNMHKEKPHYVRFHPLNSGNTADDWLPRFATLPEAICKAALLAVIGGDIHVQENVGESD